LVLKVDVVPLALLKTRIPAEVNEMFRRVLSRRREFKKGVLQTATLTAICKYAGVDPEASLVASSSFLSVEAPPDEASRVLSVLLPQCEVLISAPAGAAEVRERLKEIELVEGDEGYTVFRCRSLDVDGLRSLGSFRAEWPERELVFEDGCLSLTAESLQASLSLAKKVAPILGLQFPHTTVKGQLEVYRWRGIEGQEVIIK